MSNVPINDNTPLVHYTASAGQTVASWTFWVEDAADLLVYVDGVLKTLNTDYTVDLIALKNDDGGDATFLSALVGGEIITFSRATVVDRVSGFSESGAGSFRGETLNLELSRIIAMIQDAVRDIGRCFRLSAFSTYTGSLVLPEASANKALKWNAAGNAIVNSTYDPDVLGTAGATATAAAATATSAAATAVAAANSASTSETNAAASAASALAVGNGVLTTKGDLVTYAGGLAVHLAVGADGLVLVADSGQAKGLKYGQVGTAGIADTAITVAKLAAGMPVKGLVILEDQKSSGTNGGTSSGGSNNTRVLNTKVVDTGAICTLASNQFQLPGGSYQIAARAQGRNSNGHQLMIANITDGTFPLVGLSCNANNGGNTATTGTVEGRITIAGAKTFELQHYFATGAATSGLGLAVSSGQSEVYAQVIIIQET